MSLGHVTDETRSVMVTTAMATKSLSLQATWVSSLARAFTLGHADFMKLKLHHINLCSTNVPEMDRFYRDVLTLGDEDPAELPAEQRKLGSGHFFFVIIIIRMGN